MKKTVLIIISILLYALNLNAQLTPQEAISQLGRGINIGNTLDPPDGEGTWNNGPMQEYYFDDIKNAGFSTVRLPVTWCKHTASASPYTIDQVWLNRVEQVVDWGLARGLNIILDMHHEDSIKSHPTKATVAARFDSTWAQISVRFKSKSEKLFFEMLNEPHASNNAVTQPIIDNLNTRVLKIIRKTNPTRIVLFSGIRWANSDELVATKVPDINDKFLIGYYHSYDPWSFAGEGKGTYGSTSDMNATEAKFVQIANWSAAKGIPVIMDEFGAVIKADYNSRMIYLATVTEKGLSHNVGLCYWDDGGDFRIYDRTARTWSEAKDVLVYSTIESPTNFKLATNKDTIELSWVNRTTANDSIVIERKKGSANFEPIDTLISTANQYKDTTTIAGSTYYYRVKTTLNKTTLLYSYPQLITVVSSVRTPYLGTAVSIPGVVEAENYDLGGEGFTFHDTEIANQGKGYRLDEGVDIEALTAGGYQVGYTAVGEWLEYSINVTATDDYKIETQVASMEAGGSFNFVFKKEGSTSITSNDVAIPSTGGWQTMKTVSSTVNIPSGSYIMRVNIKALPSFNLNNFTFTKANTSLFFTESDNSYNFSISPNPAKEVIHISDIIDSSNSNQPIEIFNTQGVLQMNYLRNSAEKSVTLNISNLEKGIYIIRIGTCNKKIVIKE